MTVVDSRARFVNAVQARNRAAMNDAAREMFENGMNLGGEWMTVAKILMRNGETEFAVAAAERAANFASNSGPARLQLAEILADSGRQDEALALAKSLGNDVHPVARLHFVGTCALETGDFDLARDSFETLLARWPGVGVSWLSLAAVGGGNDQALLGRLDAAGPAIAAATTEDQARWHYARGTVLDRLDDVDRAFAAFSDGAAIMQRERPYDAAADRAEADAIVASDWGALADGASRAASTDRPILVTGFPRSGTTLVEQILARHSAVAGGDELPFASILGREVGGDLPEDVARYDAEHGIATLTDLYLHLGDERFGADRRFVDKWLGMSRLLGVVAAALPDAPIVWLRRDPLDCGWSCFRTFFSDSLDWSWSQAGIAAHYALEDRLRRHWSDVLGDRLMIVDYEQLVDDPDAQVAAILNHVGLEPEADLTKPADGGGRVTTASLAQVRQPLHRDAVGAFVRYREHLQPLVDALQAEGQLGDS